MKMNFTTEIIDQYMRESSVNPDNEARIINIGEITNIFSIGTDNSLYLTKENESGAKSRFSRVKILNNVKSFAAEKLTARRLRSELSQMKTCILHTQKSRRNLPLKACIRWISEEY